MVFNHVLVHKQNALRRKNGKVEHSDGFPVVGPNDRVSLGLSRGNYICNFYGNSFMNEDEMLSRLRSRGSYGDELSGLAGEHIQHLRLELYMVKAVLSPCNWRSIGTGPKDEIPVLLYNEGWRYPVFVGLYAETVNWEGKEIHRYWDIGSEPWRWEPTHWMPLPLPPANINLIDKKPSYTKGKTNV